MLISLFVAVTVTPSLTRGFAFHGINPWTLVAVGVVLGTLVMLMAGFVLPRCRWPQVTDWFLAGDHPARRAEPARFCASPALAESGVAA